MYPLKLSITTKFLLVAFFTVILWLILSLIYINELNRIRSQKEIIKNIAQFHRETNLLQSGLVHLSVASSERDTSLISAIIMNDCLEYSRQIENQIRSFMNSGIIPKESVGFASLNELLKAVKDLKLILNPEDIARPLFSARLSSYRVHISDLVENFVLQTLSIQEKDIRESSLHLKISVITGVLLTFLILILFSRSLHSGTQSLLEFVKHLSGGEIPEPAVIKSGDELYEIADHLNKHVNELQNKIVFLQSLGEGNPGINYKPEKTDRLGNALVVLSQQLRQQDQDEIKRKQEDARQKWIAEGMARLGEVMRSETENVRELSFRIIQKLVSYMQIEMGVIFLTKDHDPENLLLESIAAFAYDRRKYLEKELKWGEGLPGTCAQEKETVFLTDIPENYYEVVSGTGQALPKSILLVPLKIKEKVFGVVELASLRILDGFEVDFVESVAESIASVLSTVRNNEKTAELLIRYQKQSEILLGQEENLKQNLEQLTRAQEESQKKASEISGIIHAMNQSSLVAEYSLTGRISDINEKFVMQLLSLIHISEPTRPY